MKRRGKKESKAYQTNGYALDIFINNEIMHVVESRFTSVKHKTLVGLSSLIVGTLSTPGISKPPTSKAIFY